MNTYIFHKKVDWSLLKEGFSIPVRFQKSIKDRNGKEIGYGEKAKIVILFEGKEYEVNLNNLGFDRKKYVGHVSILQVRYSPTSKFTEHLRIIFNDSYFYMQSVRDQNKGKKMQVKVPEGAEEYLTIYATKKPGVYIAEPLIKREHIDITKHLLTMTEEVAESYISIIDKKDETANIKYAKQLKKIRVLNTSIGKELKKLYHYKCQICGENFAEKYDGKIVEAHHIDSFVKSLNNDASNLMIVCPSHHRTIHAIKPEFKRKKKLYLYPNGLEESLELNEHL